MTKEISEDIQKQFDEMLEVFVDIYIRPIRDAKKDSLLADIDKIIHSNNSLDAAMQDARSIKEQYRNVILAYLDIEDNSNVDDDSLISLFSSKIDSIYRTGMDVINYEQDMQKQMIAQIEMLKQIDGAKILWGFLVEEIHLGSVYRVYDDKIQLKATGFSKGIVNTSNVSSYIPEYSKGDRVTAIEYDLPMVRGKILMIGRPKLFPLKTPADPRKKLTKFETERDNKIKESRLVEMVLIPGKYDHVIDFNDEPLVKIAEGTAYFIVYKYLISWIEERVAMKNGFNYDKAIKGYTIPISIDESETRANLLILDSLFHSIRNQNKTEDYHFLLGKMVNRKSSTVKKYLGILPSKLKATDGDERKTQMEATEVAIGKMNIALDSLKRRLKDLDKNQAADKSL